MLKTVTSAYQTAMSWRKVAWYAALIVIASIVTKFVDLNIWAGISPNEKDALGLMWQVHAAVISVGFTGLAITFQLVADPQLSPGPARRAVIEKTRFGQLLVLGVAADLAIGVAAVWFYSDVNVFLMFTFGFLPSIVAIAITYGYSAYLFSRPHEIEDLTIADLLSVARRSAQSIVDEHKKNKLLSQQIEGISNVSLSTWKSGVVPDYVAKYSGKPGVVSSIDPGVMGQLSSLLNFNSSVGDINPDDSRPVALVRVRTGDKISAGSVIYEVFGVARVERVMQRQFGSLTNRMVTVSADIEAPGHTVARDLSDLQEVLIGAIHAKRYPSIMRGFAHYKTVISAVLDVVKSGDSGSTQFYFNSDWRWLNRQIWELNEAAANAGPRVAIEATEAVYARCVDAFDGGDVGFFSAAAHSYSHIWSELLREPVANEPALEHLLVSLQNLTEWKLPNRVTKEELALSFVSASFDVWLSIMRAAFESEDERWANRVLGYEAGLFEFSSTRNSSYRSLTQQTLVLMLAWLLFRQDRDGKDFGAGVQEIVSRLRLNASKGGAGLLEDIVAAHTDSIEGTLHRWEMEDSLPLQMRQVRTGDFVVMAGLLALAGYPAATGSSVGRQKYNFALVAIQQKEAVKNLLNPDWKIRPEHVDTATRVLEGVVERWRTEEREKLRLAPLDEDRVAKFEQAVGEGLSAQSVLVELISFEASESSFESIVELSGSSFTAPKWYLVESDGVLANPRDLGLRVAEMIRSTQEASIIRRLLEVKRPGRLPLSHLSGAISNWRKSSQSPLVVIFNSFEVASHLKFDEEKSTVKVDGQEIKAVVLYFSDIEEHVALVDVAKSPRVARWPAQAEQLKEVPGFGVSVGVSDFGRVSAGDGDPAPVVTIQFASRVAWLWTRAEHEGIKFLTIADLDEQE